MTTTFYKGNTAIKFHFDEETPVAYTRFYTGNLTGAHSNYFCVANHWPQDCYTQWVEPEHIASFFQEVEADPDWVQQ